MGVNQKGPSPAITYCLKPPRRSDPDLIQNYRTFALVSISDGVGSKE